MKIIKNGVVLDVTKGAYESLFKSDGWQPYDGLQDPRPQEFMMPQPKMPQQPQRAHKPSKTDIPFSEIMQQEESSLSERLENMTKDELTEYAHQNGIVIDGASKKSQIVSIIRAAMEE